MTDVSKILSPERLYTRSECLAKKDCPIPQSPGIYAWYFNKIPKIVPLELCIQKDDRHLLYIGISPDKVGKPASKQNLRKRIRTHYSGNAAGSTLRRTLGVLLTQESHFPLRRVGSGKKMTFTHLGEQWLDDWMQENACVAWLECQHPWEFEEQLIAKWSPPLNIKGNKNSEFCKELKKLRGKAIAAARDMSIADESGQQRRR